jgi:hypothetical protein
VGESHIFIWWCREVEKERKAYSLWSWVWPKTVINGTLAWNHRPLPQQVEAKSSDSRHRDFVVGNGVQTEIRALITYVATPVADFELALILWVGDPELGRVGNVAT